MVNLAKLLVRPQWEPQEILDQQAHLSLTIAKETKKISFGHIPKDFFQGIAIDSTYMPGMLQGLKIWGCE